MRREKIESTKEKRLITALILSDEVMGAVADTLDPHLFDGGHFKELALWCLDYYKRYGEAPKHHIEGIYFSWAEKNAENPNADAIHDLLETLSDEYEQEPDLNVPYLVDSFEEYLTFRKAEKLRDDLDWSLAQGDINETVVAIENFHKVEAQVGLGTDPLNDEDAWKKAFQSSLDPLIIFPGDAGDFLHPALTRDALIAIQGPEKRGKTMWCIEFAMRALRRRKKVALFEVGDLSERQMLMRIGMRLAGLPLWQSQCGMIKYPTEIAIDPSNKDDPISLKMKAKKCNTTISYANSMKAIQSFRRGIGIKEGSKYFMTSTHANSTINVRGIQGVLQGWERMYDFVPDIIIIDYPDILAPEDDRKDGRGQINDTWKALRRLSQEYHALVLAPTQADADSYETNTQSMKNFGESKQKYAHVTGTLGLNQVEEEKALEVMRLNWIVLRESPFLSQRCLWVGQCPSLGRAFSCATLI